MNDQEPLPSQVIETKHTTIPPTPAPVANFSSPSERASGRILLISAACSIAGALISGLVIKLIHSDEHDLVLIIGAFLGTTAGTILAAQQSQAPKPPITLKIAIGRYPVCDLPGDRSPTPVLRPLVHSTGSNNPHQYHRHIPLPLCTWKYILAQAKGLSPAIHLDLYRVRRKLHGVRRSAVNK